MALPRHPHGLKLLDIGLFFVKGLPDIGPFTKRLSQPPMVGLVFARYDTDLRQFLKKTPLEVPGMRHVLRSLSGALHYMHGLDVVHADFKPANVLLKGAGAFEDEASLSAATALH